MLFRSDRNFRDIQRWLDIYVWKHKPRRDYRNRFVGSNININGYKFVRCAGDLLQRADINGG